MSLAVELRNSRTCSDNIHPDSCTGGVKEVYRLGVAFKFWSWYLTTRTFKDCSVSSATVDNTIAWLNGRFTRLHTFPRHLIPTSYFRKGILACSNVSVAFNEAATADTIWWVQ